MNTVIIDVREKDEFENEHVENSINTPLSAFPTLAPGVFSNLKDKKIVIMCLSGNRAKRAYQEVKGLGLDFSEDIEIYQGGIRAWKQSGNETIGKVKGSMPILRQVQLTAGAMTFASAILGFIVSPMFFYIAGFVGAGLMFSGLTGNCMMADILAKMPWNKSKEDLKSEVCTAKTGSTIC